MVENAVAKTATPKAAKAPREPTVKKIAGYAPDTRYTMGLDKEGKPYSASNNPKRAGSRAAEWFAKLKNNGKLADAVAAGVPAGDIKWNLDKGFIKIAA